MRRLLPLPWRIEYTAWCLRPPPVCYAQGGTVVLDPERGLVWAGGGGGEDRIKAFSIGRHTGLEEARSCRYTLQGSEMVLAVVGARVLAGAKGSLMYWDVHRCLLNNLSASGRLHARAAASRHVQLWLGGQAQMPFEVTLQSKQSAACRKPLPSTCSPATGSRRSATGLGLASWQAMTARRRALRRTMAARWGAS